MADIVSEMQGEVEEEVGNMVPTSEAPNDLTGYVILCDSQFVAVHRKPGFAAPDFMARSSKPLPLDANGETNGT